MTLVTNKHRFTISFDTSSFAFDDDFPLEVECILKAIIKRVRYGASAGNLKDTHGNSIGEWVSK